MSFYSLKDRPLNETNVLEDSLYKMSLNVPNESLNFKKIIWFHFKFLFLFSVFLSGILLTDKNKQAVSFYEYQKTEVEITGIVVQRESRVDNLSLILRVEAAKASTQNIELEPLPKYAKVPVAMFQKIELYERLKIKGVSVDQSRTAVSGSQFLLSKYETRKFIYDPEITLNRFNSVEKINNYTPKFYEKILSFISEIGNNFQEKIQANMHEPYASIASGISLGKTEYLSKDIKDIFINSGLIHLMVLSGSNVSLVIVFIWFIFSKFEKRKRVFLSIFFSWFFIFMTGLNPPSVRAGLMATLALTAALYGKNYNLVSGLLIALFLMSLFDPLSLIYNPSLHLSFLACFGLFLVSPVVENFLIKNKKVQKIAIIKNRKLIKIFSLIFSMTFTTSFYLLGLTGKVSLASGFATLLAEPLIVISMLLTFLIILFSFINILLFSFIAKIFGILNSIIIFIFLKLAEYTQNNFGVFQFEISRNFVILFYTIFIIYFYYLYKKLDILPEIKIYEKY